MNKVKCLKCGDIIESKYRHDYVTCSCGYISIDGGDDYQRIIFKEEDSECFEYWNDKSNKWDKINEKK